MRFGHVLVVDSSSPRPVRGFKRPVEDEADPIEDIEEAVEQVHFTTPPHTRTSRNDAGSRTRAMTSSTVRALRRARAPCLLLRSLLVSILVWLT